MGEQLQTAATIIECAMGSVFILYTMYKVNEISNLMSDTLKSDSSKIDEMTKCIYDKLKLYREEED